MITRAMVALVRKDLYLYRWLIVGTLVGVILIVLLNSVLSIMQMPEPGRQVIYVSVIILMLLVYGRGQKVTQ